MLTEPSISIPMAISKKRGNTTIILSSDDENYQKITMPQNYNEKLVNAFAKAYKWHQMVKNREVSSLNEIAKKEKTDSAYIAKIFRLNYVAPDIIEAILNGEQPEYLKLRDFTHKSIPDLWEEQRQVFGF